MINDELSSVDPNKGQVEKAITNWSTWGRHYLPAFIEAHKHRMTTNFKDATLQGYATPNTRSFIDHGEAIFLEITPPKPSINNSYRIPINGRHFVEGTMYSQGGCFGPDTELTKSDGLSVLIKDVVKGTTLVSDGIKVKVECVVISPPTDMIQLGGRHELEKEEWECDCCSECEEKKVRINKNGEKCKRGGVWITKKHPIYDNFNWVHAETFEHDSEDVEKLTCYNLVLDNWHAVTTVTEYGDTYIGVTLGHGLKNGAAAHDYLGTSKIIEDLRKCKGWELGRVELKGFRRNEQGYICGIEEA